MDRDTFLFIDRIKQIESSFIKDSWITIYENDHSDGNNETLIYCCIVESQRIKPYRLDTRWR